MKLIDNFLIKEQLSGRSFFDLSLNNKRLDVIIPLENNTEGKLKEIFNKIIIDDKLNDGHYCLQNLFAYAHTIDPDFIVDLIVDTIHRKLKIIHDTIYDEKGNMEHINLGMYIQLWKSYKDFSQNIYILVNKYIIGKFCGGCL